MFILFLILIIGPIIAKKFISFKTDTLPDQLIQPTGLNNNDTSNSQTGTGVAGAAATSAGAQLRRAFVEYAS